MPAATRLVGVGPGWLGGPRVDPGKTTLASMGRLAPPLCLGNDMGVATVIMPNVLGWLPVKHAHERQTLLCPGDANEALHHACPGDGVVRSDAVDREDCVLVVGLGGKGDGSDNVSVPALVERANWWGHMLRGWLWHNAGPSFEPPDGAGSLQ